VGEVLPDEAGDYVGTPVVFARRLCDKATAGQILCSGVVVELLRGRQAFQFAPVGVLELKGFPDPLPGYAVEYEPGAPAALVGPMPFAGRRAELQRLARRLEQARAGQGGVVLVAGEPGIGKTRTLEEFAEQARPRGALVLWGRCYEGDAGRPYGPFAEALEEHARTAAPEQLRADLGPGAAPLMRLVPALRERLPDLPEPVALDPWEERVRLLDAVTQFLLALAMRTPTVLVLDDLHWADQSTVALLRHVARFAPRGRLLVVGAYRDVEVDREHPLADALGTLPRETSYEQVALAGLDPAAVRTLVDGFTTSREVSAAWTETLARETSGNPFFIREVLLHLAQEAGFTDTAGGEGPAPRLEVPATVRQVIERRLGRLSEAANRLLRAAAGFTGSFRFDVAARVANLDEADALDAIDEALAAQLLCSTGTAETFDFTHALVRHTLYAELSPPRQVRLHRQIAEVMEQVYGDGSERAGEIARHYHRSASLPGAERGVAYCLLAAECAEQSAAFAEAAEYLRIALELGDPSDPRRPRLLARLALALTRSLALDQVEQTATQAAAAIATAESNGAAAEFLADVADAVWVAALALPLAWSLATHGLSYLGDRRDATWARLMFLDIERREATDPEFPGIPVESREQREVVARLWEMPAFRHVGQQIFASMAFRSREDVLARAGNDPSTLFGLAGEYRKVLPLLEQATTTALERGQIAMATYYLTLTARLRAARGDLESSLSAYARALQLQERVNDPPWLRNYMAAVPLGQILLTGEGWELALAVIEAQLQEGAAPYGWATAALRTCAALCAAQLGRTDDALHWLAASLPAIERAPGSAINYPGLLSTATAALEALGRTDHIEILERNLREKWLQPDFRYVGADARLSLAMLCGLQGRPEEAAAWFAKARETLDEQGARPMRARADLYEARMYFRRAAPGDRERAAMLLNTALEQFRSLGMTGWARQAEAILAQLDPAAHTQSAIEVVATAAPAEQLDSHPPTVRGAIFRNEGDYWLLTYEGVSARVKDARGLHYLAQLLQYPGREFHVLDLLAQASGEGPDAVRVADGGLEVLDAPAKVAYRQRLVGLREELEEAEQFNDAGRAERARAELDAIAEQLAAAAGLGGRDRQTSSAAERARSAVGKRIRTDLQRIRAAHPALGRHLAATIATGYFCAYEPARDVAVHWEL
jgi:tetratricopeptide (TPR) repeat protein